MSGWSGEERRVKNALKLAGFPFLKTLDSFDFAFQPSLDRGRVMDLASLGFIARKENVLLLGPPGVGKSHLAVALAVCACQNGASVYFTTLDAMIRSLAAADRAGKLPQKLRSFTTKSQLLVLDEVGYLPLYRFHGDLVELCRQAAERRWEFPDGSVGETDTEVGLQPFVEVRVLAPHARPCRPLARVAVVVRTDVVVMPRPAAHK